MAIIDKDFTTVKRISSIPIEYQDQLKVFFDEINVIYSEGPVTLNWNNVMAEIRNNFSDWLEDGGWEFLIKDFASESEGGEGGEDEMENSDPSAAYDDEEDSEDEVIESDFSSYDEEDDDESEKNSLSEEGQSWDELERQAEEEDRKMASRRAVAPDGKRDRVPE